jgi:sec-independent protein translocase protein TatA
MGSLGLPEIIFILLIALLIFGPKRLPEIGRTLGKGMSEFRKASNDLKRTINAELSLEEDEQTRTPRRIEPPASLVQAISPISAPHEPPAGTVAQMAQMTWENPISPAPEPSEPSTVLSTAPDTTPVAVPPTPAEVHSTPAPEPSARPIEPS